MRSAYRPRVRSIADWQRSIAATVQSEFEEFIVYILEGILALVVLQHVKGMILTGLLTEELTPEVPHHGTQDIIDRFISICRKFR